MVDIGAAVDEWTVVRRRGRGAHVLVQAPAAGCDRGERSSAAVQPVAGAERKHNRRGRERTLAERAAFLCSKVREAQAEVRDSAFYRALLACLDEAQASCQAGQGSLAPSPPGTACAEGERTAGVPGCEEDHSARRQPAAASPGRNGARSVHGSDQQQLPGDEAPGPSQPQVSADEAPVARTDQGHRQRGGAPDRSQPGPASEALAALEAQGQPQCGRTPSPSQPGFHSQAATAHADLRLDSASRRRLPTARSLCYSEGPAVLDERCIGSDADSAAADECRDGRNASPAANVVGCTCSGAGPARADEHSSASGAGPASAPESGCSGGRAPTPMAWRLDEAEALVVYGLGSLEGGPVPRYQLALALLLAARMPALRPPIEAFDPVFTEVDRALLAELGVRVLDADEQGGRVAATPTLFYLPHCEAELCDNLLAANAAARTLRGVAVLGNCFRHAWSRLYAERWALEGGSAQHAHRRARPSWVLAAAAAAESIRNEPMCLSEMDAGASASQQAGADTAVCGAGPRVVEVDVAAEFAAVPAAFNDMGVHIFPHWDPFTHRVSVGSCRDCQNGCGGRF